ncbi:YcbK family protein [Falsiroseomonas sp.]|uniref:YcbK family protein n=1 Tax=Falsiroseomonas sp. TaxID=2870721 RepID=UPI00356439A2
MDPTTKRRGLLGGAALALAGLVTRPAEAVRRPGDRSRAIWIRNQAGEEVRAAYVRPDGQIDWQVVARLKRLFRDLRRNQEGPMPVLLLDMLGQVQARWGAQQPLILLSGYRTAQTNNALEGAARNSRHLEGQAADIRIPGVPMAQLAAAAANVSWRYNDLGIGTYPSFVHLDIGPRRGWRGGGGTS